MLAQPSQAAEAKDSGLLWLVNYDHPVSSDYVPSGLKGSAGGMRSEAYTAYNSMISALDATGLKVSLASAYRTYQRQTWLFTTRLANNQRSMSYDDAYAATRRYTAVPGTSEHQIGLAIDLTTNGILTDDFANTPTGQWLYAHCAEYGFIRRYDGKKEPLTMIADEAWHFRYVGLPHSLIMAQRDWCFEEYISYLHKYGSYFYAAPDNPDMVYEVQWTDTYPTALPAGVIDCSSDNAGGYIVTSCHTKDPLVTAAGHWSEPYLRRLFSREGMPLMGAVDPDAIITRGQFAILYAQLSLPQNAQPLTFSDVPAESPCRAAVDKLSRAGVLSAAATYGPERNLTRSEAAVFAARLLPDKELAWLDYADLSSIPSWAFQSVQQVSAHGLMTASDGCFRPSAPLTWGEAAKLLCQLEDLRSLPQ